MLQQPWPAMHMHLHITCCRWVQSPPWGAPPAGPSQEIGPVLGLHLAAARQLRLLPVLRWGGALGLHGAGHDRIACW
jgi:hypothetical protein